MHILHPNSVEIIELAAKVIDENKLDRVVIDPVLVCKGEDEVLHPETAEALRTILVPRATVVTPNLFEAWQLAQTGPIKTAGTCLIQKAKGPLIEISP